MSGGEIIFQGWLRKSPPEKKLRRFAWKKRWFILRSGRMSGDPDVLEYYKNDHSKKPIRVIDLHCCEQVDAGLTFKRKEFQDSFVFDIKTSDRTFYLVAETEEEMNKWVRSICQLCGFNQADDAHGGVVFPRGFSWEFGQLGLNQHLDGSPPSAAVLALICHGWTASHVYEEE
ncbi:GRB2-associated-binding protein 2 [Oryzias melastigma]|uniref:GRB2-associated-binding protein 2 n=1 Tax=Oryzias melastigma TaxID=30732 RepID=A0A834BLL0_ORYME|nr:GRB2-associated-binding protein 2 [Oryzias melastigma]